MKRLFFKMGAALLVFAFLPRVCAFGEEQPLHPSTVRTLEIRMDMDVSAVAESALAELICAQDLEYSVEYCGERVDFKLRSGASKRLPLGEYSGTVTVEQRIPAAFLERFGTPAVSGQWSAKSLDPTAAEICPAESAKWEKEYTFRSANGKATIVNQPEANGLCTLSEMKIVTEYELKDVTELTLSLCNTPTVKEYGNLCVTLGEGKGDCDILVWLGDGTASPVSVGTRYLHWDGTSWAERKVESAGLVTLSAGQSALFPRVPAQAQYSVRVTKQSAEGCTVSYSCNSSDAKLVKNGDVLSISGLVIPCYAAQQSEIPTPTVTVTVNNREP